MNLELTSHASFQRMGEVFRWTLALLLFVTAPSVVAEDLKTKDGTVYKDYQKLGFSVEGVKILHSEGIAVVNYSNLADEALEKFELPENMAKITEVASEAEEIKDKHRKNTLEKEHAIISGTVIQRNTLTVEDGVKIPTLSLVIYIEQITFPNSLDNSLFSALSEAIKLLPNQHHIVWITLNSKEGRIYKSANRVKNLKVWLANHVNTALIFATDPNEALISTDGTESDDWQRKRAELIPELEKGKKYYDQQKQSDQ
jgi:hypothetical protein